ERREATSLTHGCHCERSEAISLTHGCHCEAGAAGRSNLVTLTRRVPEVVGKRLVGASEVRGIPKASGSALQVHHSTLGLGGLGKRSAGVTRLLRRASRSSQ